VVAHEETGQGPASGGAAAQEQAAERQFRRLFDNCSDGVLMAELEARTLQYSNPAASRMLGYSAAELSTMKVDDLCPKGSSPGPAAFEALICQGRAVPTDLECGRKDGTLLSAELTTSAITIAERPLVVIYLRDGTERKHAKLALEASERQYRRLFESAKDGILILGATSGEILDANPFICSMMGCSREQLLHCHLWEIGPLHDVAASKEAFLELQAKGYVRYEHLPLESYDGRKIDVEFVSNVYPVGDELVIQCNIRDISVRIRAQAALEMRDRAIQAVSQGILISDAQDPEYPIIYASPGFERMTGYSAADALGKNCRFLQGPNTDPSVTAEIRAALQQERACTVELLNYRKDGTPFWNHLTLSPVHDGAGRLISFVGTQTDVTERRQLESQFLQTQRMEAVGRLAGGIAHDFNNVLSVILSYASVVVDDLKPEDPMRADIEEVGKAGQRATELTQQLLAFSRQQVLRGQVLDLHQVVTGMEKMLRRLLGADTELTILPASELWSIKADLGQIEQIMMNLAVNARDAMPQSGALTIQINNIELTPSYVRAHHEVKPGPYVMLSITDTGIGMDAATQLRAFEPFFTTKEPGMGTGLGLAAVFGIVKQSGGHIWISSELGRGTTFKLYFPMVTGIAQARAPELPVAEYPRASETILLVEDDDQVRALLQNLLRRWGYLVLAAPNGGEALLICEEHQEKIHLLVTDVVLPRMSGGKLAERLAPLRPEMKVLFMSGYANDEVLRHGVQELEVPYLQKPITPLSLSRKVREVLKTRPEGIDG
jgi:two-component system, cell cycle sensor histidine kinase and response regulator CckA